MSDCIGQLNLATKVDRQMLEYVDGEAENLGVTRSEFLRRLLTLYRESRREQTECPHCDEAVVFDMREV